MFFPPSTGSTALIATLVALIPFVVSISVIAIWRQSALRAGLAGMLCTLAIILTVPSYAVGWSLAAESVGTGLYNSFNISLVLLGGVSLYRVLESGGALEKIAQGIIAAIADPVHRVLGLVLGATVFFESSTGFGVGIVVVAPIFIALGFAPLKAAVLALLGQCAVPWGALSVGTVLGAEISGIPESRLGELTAVFSFPITALFGFAALKVADLVAARALTLLAVYSFVLSLLLWICTKIFGVELAGCIAGLFVIVFAVLSTKKDGGGISFPWLAFTPFAVLMCLLLVTRLVHPVRDALRSLSLPLYADYRVELFYHAGFMLLVSALIGIMLFSGARRVIRATLCKVLQQWALATLAVASFIVFGQLMKDAGMTGQIASTVAGVSSTHYLLLAPVIGALGGFMTASNAASNALFMALQTSAAAELDLPVDVIAASQNAAGSNVTLASPGRLIFAASIIGEAGSESTLLRRVAPVTLAGVASASVVTLLLGLYFSA